MNNEYVPTQEEMDEWNSLEGEEARRGLAHRKECKKHGIKPTPPSQWIKCPLCEYRTPGSLVSHYTQKHGGLNNVAKQMGVLPEDVPIVTEDLRRRSVEAGAKAAKPKEEKAKAEATNDAPDLSEIA